VLDDSATEALAIHPGSAWDNKAADVSVNADPDPPSPHHHNLIRNAARAMANRKPRARARIIASLSPRGLDLADNGPGLPARPA